MPRRRVWHLPPDGFAELRRSCLLSRKACADLLGCSLSAVKAWDRGTHRVPWSAVKLLRLFRLGDLGTLRPEWYGWAINRNGLVSPEGFTYSRADLGWWSLTCRQAEAFRRSYDKGAQRRATGRSVSEPPSGSGRGAAPLGEPPGRSGPSAGLPPADCFCSPPLSGRGALTADSASKPAGASAASPAGAGLVSFQKQVRRKGQKARQAAAFRGDRS